MPARATNDRPLLVLALGGNALSPPAHGEEGYGVEREIVATTGHVLDTLCETGYRLLIVHGNGPQVGRLLRTDPEAGNLDIHIAQTQGELGYLIAETLSEPSVCIMTRVLVDRAIGEPVKPIGPVLQEQPDGRPAMKVGDGWRELVRSPKPQRVIEQDVIATLLTSHHVIAGGGGGVALAGRGEPVGGVIDKDWVASLLAIGLDAAHLVFATDVDYVYANFGSKQAESLTQLDLGQARQMIADGSVMAGSMAPKLASAVDYADSTERPAHICALADIREALEGRAGTVVG